MTNTPSRVLLIGDELPHLEARARVLEHFWAIALSAVGDATLQVVEADAVILCHTLPDHVRDAWVHRIRQQLPGLIVVRMNDYDSGPHAGADATVDVQGGPGALVSTIYELLTERGLPSMGWPEDFASQATPIH